MKSFKYMDNIRQIIKVMREERRITQEIFSELSGVSLRQLQSIESNAKDIKLSTLAKIAKGFSISPAVFFLNWDMRRIQKTKGCDSANYGPMALLHARVIIYNREGAILYCSPLLEDLIEKKSIEVFHQSYVWDLFEGAADLEFKAVIQLKVDGGICGKYLDVKLKKDQHQEDEYTVNCKMILNEEREIVGFYSCLESFTKKIK